MFRRDLVATLLVVLVVLAAPPKISSAHAQLVGTVCVAPQGSSNTGCPSSPIAFPEQPIGTRLVVAINIQGSDPINGFRIFIQTNTVLSPVRADLNVTLLSSFGPVLVLANCVNGTGTGCNSASGDGPGVVDVGAVELGGLSNLPTTGNLFEIVYQVMAVGSTPLSFLTGSCATGSSVPGLCVTITNGGLALETAQPGSYQPGAENPPLFTAPPPATLTVLPMTSITFNAVARDLEGQAVTLAATGLPTGATFTTSGTTTVTRVFSWVPAFGPQTATVTFTATDSAGLTTVATTVITVTQSPPTIDSIHWIHHLSLAKNMNTQTWTLTITNPGPSTVFAQVIIRGTDKSGETVFMSFSTVITLPAGGSVQITLTHGFTFAVVVEKFFFVASLVWGASPSFSALILPGGNTKAGSFTVIP